MNHQDVRGLLIQNTYLGMIVAVKSLGLRTQKARPWGSQHTMLPFPSFWSISCNFSGKGMVTPPVFFLVSKTEWWEMGRLP